MKPGIFLLILIILNFTIIYAQSHPEIINTKNDLENSTGGNLSYEPQIFIADIETIDDAIKNSSKSYKIVYNFSISCPSSLQIFPKLIDFAITNNFDLFPIYGNREIDTARILNYLMENRFSGNLYILDTNKYGRKKNPFSRIRKLTQHLCKECNYKKMGFSSFYVLDESNRVVVHNNWMIPGMRKIEKLREWYLYE